MWIETLCKKLGEVRISICTYIKWYSRKFIQSRRLKSFAPQFYLILTFWRVEWRERQSDARGKEALRRNSWSWGWLNWVNSAITLVTWRFTSYGYKWQMLKVNFFVQFHQNYCIQAISYLIISNDVTGVLDCVFRNTLLWIMRVTNHEAIGCYFADSS